MLRLGREATQGCWTNVGAGVPSCAAAGCQNVSQKPRPLAKNTRRTGHPLLCVGEGTGQAPASGPPGIRSVQNIWQLSLMKWYRNDSRENPLQSRDTMLKLIRSEKPEFKRLTAA